MKKIFLWLLRRLKDWWLRFYWHGFAFGHQDVIHIVNSRFSDFNALRSPTALPAHYLPQIEADAATFFSLRHRQAYEACKGTEATFRKDLEDARLQLSELTQELATQPEFVRFKKDADQAEIMGWVEVTAFSFLIFVMTCIYLILNVWGYYMCYQLLDYKTQNTQLSVILAVGILLVPFGVKLNFGKFDWHGERAYTIIRLLIGVFAALWLIVFLATVGNATAVSSPADGIPTLEPVSTPGSDVTKILLLQMTLEFLLSTVALHFLWKFFLKIWNGRKYKTDERKSKERRCRELRRDIYLLPKQIKKLERQIHAYNVQLDRFRDACAEKFQGVYDNIQAGENQLKRE